MITLDASVVIALLQARDPHHHRARELLDDRVDEELSMHVLTRTEVLVGPTRDGRADDVIRRIDGLEIRTVEMRESDAVPLAELRVRTGLNLPDACVVLAARLRGASLATFDDRLRSAAASLAIRVLP